MKGRFLGIVGEERASGGSSDVEVKSKGKTSPVSSLVVAGDLASCWLETVSTAVMDAQDRASRRRRSYSPVGAYSNI